MREQKRQIDRAIRSIESETVKLDQVEKKIIADMKKAAKENNVKSLRIMAKDVVRSRKNQEKFINLKTQLRAVSMQMVTMQSTQALTEAMRNASRAMKTMNRQMNMPQLQKIMMEFAQQSEMMEQTQEMVGDSIDDAMEMEDEAEETDTVVNQILDEIGINMSSGLVDAPTGQAQVEENKNEDALATRLNNLGK
jgi:charged multivesicular body protein 2A